MSDSCPKCQSNELRWHTVRRGVPVDVLQCSACGTVLAEEDWMAPLQPVAPGVCINCGDRRSFDVCDNCGLSKADDAQVHDELRFMIDPNANMMKAAKVASRQGRRLIALKLATAAALTNEGGEGEKARALRVWLLSAVGEKAAAHDDAEMWVKATQDPSALAWASYGQQLQHTASPGAAAEAYHRALKKDPRQHSIRARRAALLLELHREGQSIDETCRVFEAQGDEASIEIAIEVAEQLCELFESRYRDDEISLMLTRAGGYATRSAKLLAQRARLKALNGDVRGAKKDLKRARKIEPELEIYERVERAMKPARSSWWRW